MFYFSFFLVIVGKKILQISMTMFIMNLKCYLNRLHEPDYTRKDAFLIGTTLYIYGKPYTRTMYDDEFGSAEVFAICTLTDMKVEAKNIKISDIFYFLNDSTTKKGNKAYKLIRECLNYI